MTASPAAGTAPLVVAVSPHLDDAAFSAGGLLATLVDGGWRVRVVTCLTRSVPDPTGFALACQTDKGLGPEVDYMALRRAEDARSMRLLGVTDVVHLPLPEAPHRGYASPAALFAGVRQDDDLVERLATALGPPLAGADRVLAPQGLGGHVDHLLVAAAVARLADPGATTWWRDTPYVIRDPAAARSPGPPHDLVEQAVDVTAVLERKVAACQQYASQLGFQFGGPAGCASALAGLARAEGRRLGVGHPAEAVSAPAPAVRWWTRTAPG